VVQPRSVERRLSTVAEVDVYLEVSAKRVFACAYDWPGWCRSGKTEEAALDTLAAYASRSVPAVRAAGLRFDDSNRSLSVVERVPGDATTAFGAPSKITSRDLDEPSNSDKERILALLAGSWEVFDDVVAGAPEGLRKGPRGGGRDRTKIVAHVLAAEAGYSRLLGARLRELDPSETDAIPAHRVALLDALRAADATRRGNPGRNRWPMRYAVRRLGWHTLDHAWEIEDRSST
jgi:hypothetical protein